MATSSNVASLQSPNPATATVSRQPQTTAASGGPFVRLARKAKIQGFSTTANLGGAQVTQTLKPVGGYLRGLILTVQATGGTSTTTVAAAADAPWNVIQSLVLRDPSGQPIIQLDGYGLYLLNCYSAQIAELGYQDPMLAPSYTAIQTASGSGAGDFQFRVWIPLELDSAGYCCLPGLNASAQPTLQITPNTSGAVYSTAPSTLPTLTFTVNQSFWTIPVASPNTTPPGLGSSSQWTQTQGQQAISSGAFVRSAIPATGAWWHTAIFVLRDSTNARVNAWPSGDEQMLVDGVPLEYESSSEREDLIFQYFGLATLGNTTYTSTRAWGAAGPTGGVQVYTFRDSVRRAPGMDDTHDLLLPTTPATLLEIAGTWGSITNSPGQLQAYVGQLYPDNPTSIPYTHLAQ